MSKLKKQIIFLMTLFLICVSIISLSTFKEVKAESSSEKEVNRLETELQINAEPYVASLSLSINGGNGEIWATVRNDFTFLSNTVMVIIELYSSPTYYENHEDMTLVEIDSTLNLNIYKSISVSSSTGGVKQYWQARMRYKIDSAAWEERNTGTLLFDADGTFLDII